MEAASLHGQMAASMKESSKTITSKDTELTFGSIKGSMWELGKPIKCMGRGFSREPMGAVTLESTQMTKKKGTECSHGPMGDNMKDLE